METVVKVVGRLALVMGGLLFAIYSFYWLMFLPYMISALTINGGWRLWFDIGTREGIAAPVFLWFLTLMNPITIVLLYAKVQQRRTSQNSGVSSD